MGKFAPRSVSTKGIAAKGINMLRKTSTCCINMLLSTKEISIAS